MSSSRVLKDVAQRLAPGIYESIRWRFGLPARYKRIMEVVSECSGGKVMAGPFAGMVCADATSGNHVPKLLGCYELELHGIVEACIQRGYRHIIDVGAGEGYYVVGLARRMSQTRVYAFDTSSEAQAACQAQARRNGVAERVTVAGSCDAATLAGLPLAGSLLICDCEGYEGELLNPEAVPGLVECDMLVELHDHLVAGVTPLIQRRFATTHSITLIPTVDRDADAYEVLAALTAEERALAVSEGRTAPMRWAYLAAHAQTQG